MIPSESASAEKYYSLYSPAEDAENGTLGALNNLDITGINPRFIIKSDSYSPVSLKGSGFTETATVMMFPLLSTGVPRPSRMD